ncbi:Nn.00g068130.m01.CDS01 [Neocucurbitaria sp. VM-36]
MTPYDLTTEDGLRTYLKTTGRSKEIGVTLLSGGTANYVYRVAGVHGFTSIFKHAAPYLHSNKDFAFDPTRMDYEARALEILSPANTENPISQRLPESAVHAVRLMSYDKERKLLCIGDGGNRNLKNAYEDPKLDIPMLGKELAKWVAALHMCSKDISLALSDQKSTTYGNTNNLIAVNIYRHSYKNLHSALSRYGHDTKLADRINEEFGSLLETDDECICHGDYWTGNVLVRLNNSQQKPVSLTVVDWEMVRRGTSATDVAQFAAEAFLLDRFRGGRGLLSAFLNAYIGARESDALGTTLGKAWARRVVVHWAVHVAFWPTRVVWTDEKGTQQLVSIGVDALEGVLNDDWEALLESPLLKDVKEAWTPTLARG